MARGVNEGPSEGPLDGRRLRRRPSAQDESWRVLLIRSDGEYQHAQPNADHDQTWLGSWELGGAWLGGWVQPVEEQRYKNQNT